MKQSSTKDQIRKHPETETKQNPDKAEHLKGVDLQNRKSPDKPGSWKPGAKAKL